LVAHGAGYSWEQTIAPGHGDGIAARSDSECSALTEVI
jgi:hypothetical protein